MDMDKHLGAAREGVRGLEGAGRLRAVCPISSRRTTSLLPTSTEMRGSRLGWVGAECAERDRERESVCVRSTTLMNEVDEL